MLAMYGLYKQITEGPCTTGRPGFWNVEGRAKWDAWHKMGDMSREEAMELYVMCAHEAIDVASEVLDWDEMLTKYSDLYEELSFLREKFIIIGRELIKEYGTKVTRPRSGLTDLERLCAGPYSLDEKFRAVAEVISVGIDYIKNMPKTYLLNEARKVMSGEMDISQITPVPISFAEIFTMYALYKQATVGPCTTGKPFWNIVERYKWEAWKRLGDTSKDQAKAGYVVGFLEKIDYCAVRLDWDMMLDMFKKEYDLFESRLRQNFRIIDRELIKEDGSRVIPPPFHDRIIGILVFNFDNAKKKLKQHEENDLPDEEFFDVSDTLIQSRSTSPLEDAELLRSQSVKRRLVRMKDELMTLKSSINTLAKVSEDRHRSIVKLIKISARIPWRSLMFILVWPIIYRWIVKYFRGPPIA